MRRVALNGHEPWAHRVMCSPATCHLPQRYWVDSDKGAQPENHQLSNANNGYVDTCHINVVIDEAVRKPDFEVNGIPDLENVGL